MKAPSRSHFSSHFLIVVVAISLLVEALPTATAEASDTSTRWESISESSGCGDPYTRGPFASRRGFLSSGEAVLGPFGTYFGRSLAEIEERLVWWTVPFSGGRRIRVHELMFPALRDVSAGLSQHASAGRVYPISSVGGFSKRTIGGRYQISRHAMGLAIDINPARNPFRSDAKLITDMPSWFVETWEDAGFCWGGRWLGVKDPMHFSWMGPRSTPDPNDSLDPVPPKTAQKPFDSRSAAHGTEFAPVVDRYQFVVADGSGNGAPDVVGVRSHPDGAVIDVSNSMGNFGECSIFRWFVPNTAIANAEHVTLADVDGDSGQDLVALVRIGSSYQAVIATRRERFEDPVIVDLELSDVAAVTAADFDGDGISDLWASDTAGGVEIWAGPLFQVEISQHDLPDGAPVVMAAGDRDGGDIPELFLAYPDGASTRVDVLSPDTDWARETSTTIPTNSEDLTALGAGDYDGDGRADLQILDSSGRLEAYVGNTSTGIPAARWFLDPAWDCDQPLLLDYSGLFMDDEGNTFEANIDSIGESGITKGCNPPFNDWFCPGSTTTRGQMAAFLVRALGLSNGSHPGFADVPANSTFAEDINRLATAGITKGCNPPANDRFCPEDPVSRGQMAAFLVRALGLQSGNHSGFGDVSPNSTFVEDINRLATAGITKGCNPPANDRYCPEDPVTRGQMAAFLDRAGLAS